MDKIIRNGKVFFDEDAFKEIIPEDLAKAMKEEERPSFSIRALKGIGEAKPTKLPINFDFLLFSSYDVQNAIMTGKYKPKTTTNK